MTSYNTKAAAKSAAYRLKKKLYGYGWKVEVWESLGWHFTLRLGNLSLIEDISAFDGSKTYWTLLSATHPGAGDPDWNIDEIFTSPNEAVMNQLDLASKDISEKKKVVDQIKSSFYLRNSFPNMRKSK